jgi:hypothetical protein
VQYVPQYLRDWWLRSPYPQKKALYCSHCRLKAQALDWNFLKLNHVASTTLEPFSGVPATYNSLDWVIPGMEATQHLNLSDLTDIGFGELNQIWDWENLDLSFDFFSRVAT